MFLLQEPAIANAMLKQGVLNSQECQDFSENKELKSFRVRNLLVEIHKTCKLCTIHLHLNKGREKNALTFLVKWLVIEFI